MTVDQSAWTLHKTQIFFKAAFILSLNGEGVAGTIKAESAKFKNPNLKYVIKDLHTGTPTW